MTKQSPHMSLRGTLGVYLGEARMTKQSLQFWIIVSILLLAACSSGSSSIPATGTSIAGQVSITPGTALPVSRTPTQPAHTPTPQETLDLTDEDLRGTVIHFYHAWSGESGKVIRQLVDEFNLSNRWGIVVVPVMHSSYDELNAELDISLAQRNPPDLAAAYLHQALSWNLVGGLVELDRYVNDPNWGMSSDEQADFYPVFWEQDILAEKRLGIPAQRSGQMLYYNRSWAEELGFEFPAFEYQKHLPNRPVRRLRQSVQMRIQRMITWGVGSSPTATVRIIPLCWPGLSFSVAK